MPVITTIEDLKRMHKRRTPKMFYDYAESGSWTEQTFRENTSDFDQIRLRQRVKHFVSLRRSICISLICCNCKPFVAF